MQGQRKRNRKLLSRELIDFRDNAAGRYRNIALADVLSVFIRKKPDKPKQIVVIIKRFAGSHDNHMRNPFARDSSDLINLPQHFRRQKAPDQSVDSGSAESAAHAAADLRGNTDAVTESVFHKNAFHRHFCVPSRADT